MIVTDSVMICNDTDANITRLVCLSNSSIHPNSYEDHSTHRCLIAPNRSKLNPMVVHHFRLLLVNIPRKSPQGAEETFCWRCFSYPDFLKNQLMSLDLLHMALHICLNHQITASF